MSISTIADARVYILSPAFLQNNPEFEHERGSLITGKLEVVNVSRPLGTPAGVKAMVQLANPAGVMQATPMDAHDAEIWYRAMPRNEYLYLKRFGKIAQDDSYGTITTNAIHAKSFMGGRSSNTHLVEFDLSGHTSTLYNQLRGAAQSRRIPVEEPIADSDGDTFGIGGAGHYAGQAGKLFNELLIQSSWRLVHVYLMLR